MTAVTVCPVGHRMETLIPVPVAFGHDGTGRRRIRYGGEHPRGTEMLRVNGVTMSVFYSMVEDRGRWTADRSGGLYLWRTDRHFAHASEAARAKVRAWLENATPRLAEKHRDMFDQEMRVAASAAAADWDNRRQTAWRDADLCRRYSEVATLVFDGVAEVVTGGPHLDVWKAKGRLSRQRPSLRMHDRYDGPLEATAVAVLDGETIAVGVNVDGHLCFVPAELIGRRQ